MEQVVMQNQFMILIKNIKNFTFLMKRKTFLKLAVNFLMLRVVLKKF